MIIYGTNTARIKTKDMPKVECTRCNETGHKKMSRYVKYVHLFWIPTFPYGTEGLSQCTNCDYVLNYDEMYRSEQDHFNEFKEFARLPIWSFSGVILILGVILWAIMSIDIDNKLTRELAESPMTEDVCYLEWGPNSYSTFRISEIAGDTLFVNFNEMETNKQSAINEIDISSNYLTDTVIMTRTYLLGMLDAEQIIEIKRDE